MHKKILVESKLLIDVYKENATKSVTQSGHNII